MSASTPALEVRLVRHDEIATVRNLVREAYAGDFELSAAYLAEIESVAERARAAEVWVAADTATGVLLGTVTTPHADARLSPVAQDDDELDFRFLGVSAAARGRGVGETLVRHVLALAASRGIRRVVLNTGPEMLAAQRLYERLGFGRLREREYEFVRPDGSGFLMMAYGRDIRPGDADAEGRAAA